MWWNVRCAYSEGWVPNSGGGNESVWWSITVMAVGNDSAHESIIIVPAGNNSVPWVMMYAGAPC